MKWENYKVYAELVCRSNYSFLRGASHPEELVATAATLGLSGLAIADDDGLYGLVKAHLEAKQRKLKLVLASRMTLTDAPPVALYVQTAEGYAHLCELISESRLSHPKGHAGLPWRRLLSRARGLALVMLDDTIGNGGGLALRTFDVKVGAALVEAFEGRAYVGVSRHFVADDGERWAAASTLSDALEVPLVAHNDVHTHHRERQPLQDVMTAIRHGVTVSNAGTLVFANAERTLKNPAHMLRLFADAPECVGRTMEIIDGCSFSLDDVHYTFSEEELPVGMTPRAYLALLCEHGMQSRYPGGIPVEVRHQVEKELRLISTLEYEGYFLALWDVVRFARSVGILCQGRGSAANSAVCYVLHITSIDPVRMGLLFERFLSMERREPPDIDIDFEHERREEVLQYVYEKHGRHRAAMVCEHICFRGKLAVKEVGKALGLSIEQLERLSSAMDISDDVGAYQLHQAGLSASDLAVQQTMALSRQLMGMPRHLSIHVGGFVITHGPLVSIAPIETAAMKDRTVVQWEKDDLAALDVLKVDLLGLGMLTVVARSFELIEQITGNRFDMASVPAEDPAVYDMICEADTIGVFQIESRAQQNMLPRLLPRTFYDLVIEIAIIRPGPIVGQMVHPYLKRRNGEEPVTYPSLEVKAVLERTLGIPLFQEQAMKLSMVAAGFSPGEADALRRALSHKRAHELMPPFRDRYVEGCLARGYTREFAEKTFDSFKGFSHYGFPESHSASFALIAYVSSWLKRYYPAIFCAALLDAQPMGFYAPHTLVDDAKRHQVEVRRIDINQSAWKCRLESDGRTQSGLARKPGHGVSPEQPAVRLGFSLVKGLSESAARRVVLEREREGLYTSLSDVARRTRLPRADLTRLILAGAFASLIASRREALWELAALGTLDEGDLFFGLPMATDVPAFPPMSAHERVASDFDATNLSLESHPVGLLRAQLQKAGAVTAAQLQQSRSGAAVQLGGLVIVRQRPPTAKGFCFLSLEDETGVANLVIEPKRFEQFRKEITQTALLLAAGRVERSGNVVNVKVDHLEALDVL